MLALLGGCAHAPTPDSATGIARYGRPHGMPIGTGPGQLEDPDATPPPEVGGNASLSIPKYEVAGPPPPPCSGCVELSVLLNDINQRDEFAFDARGAGVTRVIWTLLVNLNSDQLAVQPFVNERKGKYTEIDANAFPLGKPVELVQEFQGAAQRIGLIVASSGAWTGAQRVSVFVDAVRVEGPRGFELTFDSSAEGFTARTRAREPRVDFHPGSTSGDLPSAEPHRMRPALASFPRRSEQYLADSYMPDRRCATKCQELLWSSARASGIFQVWARAAAGHGSEERCWSRRACSAAAPTTPWTTAPPSIPATNISGGRRAR